jgi:hypothetical protein
MSLLPNENCHFSEVSSESGANATSPAAMATASNELTSDLDDLMASTRQCLLDQFADCSVCANQNKFHKDSILVSDLRIYLFTSI